MGAGRCKSWGKRAKYENKSYCKSPDLFLRASPCASSPPSAWKRWDRGAAGISQHPVLPAVGVRLLTTQREKFVSCPEMAPVKARMQHRFPGALKDLLKASFSSDRVSIHSWGHTQVLVSLGARLKRGELICGQRRELRCTAAGCGFEPSVSSRDSFSQAIISYGKTEQLVW